MEQKDSRNHPVWVCLVYKFLKGSCSFLDISRGVFKALDKFCGFSINEVEEVFDLDKRVKDFCAS